MSVDDYIGSFPKEIQEKLQILRKAIKEELPAGYEEKISYGLPTFYLKKNLVHFGAFKKHIGFFPTPDGIVAFAEDLKKYQTSKGTIHFPLNEPLPLELVKEIVRFRVREVLEN